MNSGVLAWCGSNAILESLLPGAQPGWVVSGRWERQWNMEVHANCLLGKPGRSICDFHSHSIIWSSVMRSHLGVECSGKGRLPCAVKEKKVGAHRVLCLPQPPLRGPICCSFSIPVSLHFSPTVCASALRRLRALTWDSTKPEAAPYFLCYSLE